MTRYTVDQVLALRPCATYTRERITALWAGREALSVLEMLDLDIPAANRLWVAWRTLPAVHAQAALDRIVTRAVRTHALVCGVPAVEAWAVRWLDGSDRTEAAGAAGDTERHQQIADIRAVLEAACTP